MLYTCQVNDICGNTHILRRATLAHIHAEVGPMYPVIIDGRRGVLTGAPDERHADGEIRFVPATLN